MAEVKVDFAGKKMNQRTVDMLQEAERLLGFDLRLTKGSYLPADSASGATHAGGGAADLSVRSLTRTQRKQAVLQLRRVGFAAWFRTAPPFEAEHIHAIAIGDDDLSDHAKRQVKSYKRGNNGLNGDGPDNGPDTYRTMTWEKYQEVRQNAEQAPGVPQLLIPVKDVTISVTAVRMAAEGKPISHSFKTDSEQFMAFAYKGIGVIPATTFMAWRKTRDKKYFVYAVKCVQAKFGLRQDGDPGPITMAELKRFGYTIVD